VDGYVARQGEFARPILTWLRERVHATSDGIDETIKWGMPAFTWGGRPLAQMAAFQAHVAFGFWDRETMATGREGEGMGQFGRITALSDLPPASEMERLIANAVAAIATGATTRRSRAEVKPDAAVPADLAAALEADEAAMATWAGFPPSARRDYCEWVTGAKREATRVTRLATTLAQLREGKKLNWKYERG
jgi:hypothetical protein